MSAARFDTAFALVEAATRSGRIPGAVLALHQGDGTRRMRSTGLAQRVPHERPMTTDTWFDLASLTKVVFTTPRILQLATHAQIELDAPLTSVLPDLKQYTPDSWIRRVTFRECLTHQTPFPAVEPIYTYGQDPELLRAFVLQRAWRAGPAVYSDINFILLGLALERLAGCRIRALDPGPGFAFSADSNLCAATEDCTWRKRVLCGEVHDDNCAALQGAGHAGLFGTATAVLDFACSLLDASGPQADSVALMRTPVSATRTVGWERKHVGWSGGEGCSAASIGHVGFTGTGLWIDFDAGASWTLLSNRIHPSRHHDSGMTGLRRDVGDALFGRHRPTNHEDTRRP